MRLSRRSVLSTLAGTAAAAALSPLSSIVQASSSEKPSSSKTQDQPLPHDPLRPAFHYLPTRNWMNDPCAPIFHRGQYHMFHQYNPNAAHWGDMHWAHAVSPDMVYWRRLPVAIAPTPGGPDSEGVFTGSSILHNGTPAIIYTGVQSVPHDQATLSDGTHNFRETQLLATAADRSLGAWRKHPQPVIPSPPPGMKVTGFRDPAPFEHAGAQYLAVGSGIAGKGGMVLLYRAVKSPGGAPDLTNWEYLHPLAEAQRSGNRTSATDPVDTGEMWECPDFFALGNRHVLIYSTERKTFWQVGDLDPQTLRFHPSNSSQLDLGRSFYAPKTQLDAHGNRILWGWLNETRPEAEYTAAGWSGMLSLPRVLTVEGGVLRMRPLPALRSLREPVANNILNAESGPNMLLSSGGRISEFTATLQQNARPDIPSAFILSDAAGPLITIRSPAGQQASSADFVLPANTQLSRNPTIHVFFDNSVLELFLDNTLCFTKRFYKRDPEQPIATLILPGSYTAVEPTTYTLKPIWPA